MLFRSKIILFAHLLYLTYNQFCINYLPIKRGVFPPYYYILVDMFFGTFLYILYFLIILKLSDLCSDRIIDNRDLIEYSEIEERELNDLFVDCGDE